MAILTSVISSLLSLALLAHLGRVSHKSTHTRSSTPTRTSILLTSFIARVRVRRGSRAGRFYWLKGIGASPDYGGPTYRVTLGRYPVTVGASICRGALNDHDWTQG